MDFEQQIAADLGFEPARIDPETALSVDSFAVDGHTLARALNLTQRAVNALAKEGVCVRLGRGTFDLVQSTANYISKMRDSGGEKERLTKAQADLAELKLAEARKELVPATEIGAAWAAIVRDAKAALLGATSKIQTRLGHLSAHDANVIDSEIRAALQSLSESGHA